ncbi:hypothetical protein [Tardiphaga sp. 768_D3_N2_1]|uniref:hypothetical protein n=1 Tax=Tardiphaga sp. 768_D3_N2_1 TaxID=3240783 RepID=UPI003F8B0566
MRNVISKWVAAFAVVTATAGAAPAMACGGGLFAASGCSPCGQAYVSPCGYGVGYGYAGVAAYERLPDPTPVTRQYYYANQGPTFSGPGMFAPVPTYQETAIGWRGYGNGYGYGYGYRRGYDGGPYANPVNYSYGPAYRGPAITSYPSRSYYRARPSYRYGYGMRPRVGYGYAQRSYVSHTGYHQAHRYGAPKMTYAPRAAAPRGYHQQQRPQRYMH